MPYTQKYTPPHCFFCNFAGWVVCILFLPPKFARVRTFTIKMKALKTIYIYIPIYDKHISIPYTWHLSNPLAWYKWTQLNQRWRYCRSSWCRNSVPPTRRLRIQYHLGIATHICHYCTGEYRQGTPMILKKNSLAVVRTKRSNRHCS